MTHTRSLIWRTSLAVFVLVSLVLNPAITLASVNHQAFNTDEPPLEGPEHYQLKDWTADDAKAAVDEAEKLWRTTELEYPVQKWFSANGPYLFALERERLVRFDDTVNKSETYWQLASHQAVGLSSIATWHAYGVDWLVTAMKNDLNAGTISVSGIDKWIEKYNFKVVSHLDAPNLFGDNQNAVVLQVEIPDFYLSHLKNQAVIILSQNTASQFNVIPLYANWFARNDTTYGSEELITVNDTNGNGRPEIVSNVIQYGRYMCASTLSIYEWEDVDTAGEFRNIARNIPTAYSDYYECDNFWSGNPHSATFGTSSISQIDTTYAGDQDCPDYAITTYYLWSESTYLRADSKAELFKGSEDLICNIDWATITGGQNEQAVSFLEKALKNGKLGDVNWGPATEDYLRFKLGMWYALQGKAELATDTLKIVRDNPARPEFEMSSELADAFLSRYNSPGDAFVACKTAVRYIEKSYSQLLREFQFVDQIELLLGHWGFSEPHWSNFFGIDTGAVCNLRQAFQTSIKDFQPTSEQEFIELLRRHQIPVSVVKQADINGDKLNDWVIVATTSRFGGNEIWPVLTQADALVALPNQLGSGSNSYYAAITQCAMNDSQSATTLQLGNWKTVFQVKAETSGLYVKSLLGVAQNPATWNVTQKERAQALEMAKNCGLSENYFWNTDHQRFDYLFKPTIPENNKIRQLEAAVFSSNDLLDTAMAIQVLLNSNREEPLSIEQRAHFRYLQGLAYELAGHKRDAVNVYWQLWHDYPDSPYAMIIQRKLVPLEP